MADKGLKTGKKSLDMKGGVGALKAAMNTKVSRSNNDGRKTVALPWAVKAGKDGK
ncbi:MAG: hypothetical protein FWD15_04760 [Alphaproteobacteria bacterium]|nr:hypothetical protein [Alphaproteobacteria bacterium]